MSISSLTNEQIDALKITADKKLIPILKTDIDVLIDYSLITYSHGGGWLINSKGRNLLKQLKISSQGKGEVLDV